MQARRSAALVAGPVIALFGWRALFFAAGGIGLVWLACWLIWFDKPERASWLGEAERAKILAERSISRTFSGDDTRHPGLLQLLGRGPTLWGVALTQGCNVYAQYLFLTWLPSYLQHSKGLTLAKTGLFAAIPYAVAVVLCILIGRLSDRFLAGDVGGGKRRLVIASAMVLASIILLVPLVDSVWLILALISLSLAGIAATTAMNSALLNDLLPDPRNVGLAMAFLVVGGNAFGLMAPIVTGYVIDLTGSFDMGLRDRRHPVAGRRYVGHDLDAPADRRGMQSGDSMTAPIPAQPLSAGRRAILGGFAMAAGSLLAAPTSAAPSARFVYVGCRTTKERNARGLGIEVFQVDAIGTWSHVQRVAGLDNPSFLAFDRQQRFLYAVHGDLSDISAFSIEAATGKLTLLNRQSTEGRNPAHLLVDASGRYVLVANYATGTVAVLPRNADGSLGAVRQVVADPGTPGRTRLTRPPPTPTKAHTRPVAVS